MSRRHPDARAFLASCCALGRPLFFANAEIFHDRVLQAVTTRHENHWIVIVAEPVRTSTYRSDMLTRLQDELHELRVNLCFAELKGPVKDSLKHYGIFERIGERNFVPTLGRAIDRYLEVHPVEWRDWEDEK